MVQLLSASLMLSESFVLGQSSPMIDSYCREMVGFLRYLCRWSCLLRYHEGFFEVDLQVVLRQTTTTYANILVEY
jgi:hypothetical protein